MLAIIAFLDDEAERIEESVDGACFFFFSFWVEVKGRLLREVLVSRVRVEWF